jgi:2-haloacid dehalogenase
MPKPKVIIFDVNETLLDLAALKTSVSRAIGGQEELLALWFSTMLHYSLVETLTDTYHTFGEIGTAALMMVAESRGIQIEQDVAKAAIVTPLHTLPAHAEVADAMQQLRAQGYRLVSLTNTGADGAETQLKNARLAQYLEKRYSIESVKKYKPNPAPYQMVIEDLRIEPTDTMMVAAHAWDLMGAKNVGLQTAFIQRPGTMLYPNVARPDYVVKDLQALATALR